MSRDIQCTPHPNTVTKKDGGDYGTYLESGQGRKPLPFALAEKIDNAIAATTDNPPDLKKLVEVYFLFDENQNLKNICIRDNGSGMDTEGLRGYATYHYSQEARKRDAEGGGKHAASSDPLSDRNCDPQALDGKIGHFGVGGQHSVFFMGFMEHIMTKTMNESFVNDMVISGDEMHKKWDEGMRDEVYSFKVHQRKPGDPAMLDPKREKHPILQQLIERETEKDKSAQFSLFVISKIKSEHVAALKETSGDDDDDPVVKVTEELARVYHYYLHGRDGDVAPSSSSESDDAESDASESEDDENLAKQSTRKRRRAPVSISSSRKKRVNRAADDENISVKILFYAYKGKDLQLTTNLFEIENVEKLMHKRARGEPFSFGLKPHSGAQVVVCLYFFPVLFGKTTRPVDEYEEADLQEEDPILSCYWQGRWIPYAQVKKLKFLEVSKSDDTITKLQGRIRGTIWFPRNVLPSNNKLFLQKSPEAMLGETNLRIFQIPNWDEENQKGVRASFRKWLQDSAREFDMNLEFKDKLHYDPASKKTHYGKLRYGHADYKRTDKFKIRKTNHVFGVIEHFICDGEMDDSAVGSEGLFAYRRYPLEIFGGSLHIESIEKLSSKMRTAEEIAEKLDAWNNEVEVLKQKTPLELQVFIHKGDEDMNGKLRPKKLSFTLGGGSLCGGPDCYPTSLEEEAGYQIPPLDVYIVSEEGRAVNSVINATKKTNLHVQLRVKKLTDDGQDAKSRRVDSYIVDGNAHLQKKANQSNGYEFPTLGACFEGAGMYELAFHVPAFHRKVLAKEGPEEGSWVQEDPISWTTKVTIRAAQPVYFQTAKWQVQKPVLLGFRNKSLVQLSFRDQYRSAGSKKSLGNLCYLDGEFSADDFEVTMKVQQPTGLTLEVSFSDRERGENEEKGWFSLNVKATPLDGVEKFEALCQPPYKALEVKGTVHVRMKTPTGGWKPLNPLEASEHFSFVLGPGKPKKLICLGHAPSEAVEVENHEELPVVKVQAIDAWGHVVLQDKFMKALKIREVLESQEVSKELKGRRERQATWEAYEAQVDMGTGYAELGKRRVRLENPRVTRLEKHELVYSLVSELRTATAAASSSSIASNLEINVDILPSSLPHDVRAFRGTEEIEDGAVHAPAGSDVSDLNFKFYDEAGNEVNLNAKSGWVVRGGGWDRSKDTVIADPIAMPPMTMRTRAGDLLQATVVFTGPALDSQHPPKQTVDLSFIPHAAAPQQWLFSEPRGGISCKEVLQLSMGQKLREAFSLQLQDEFQNVVSAEDCASYKPKLLIITNNKEQAPPDKKGDWDTFELVGNKFIPAENACLEGGTGSLTFIVSNVSSSSTGPAPKVENSKQQMQLVCGKPHRLRMSLVGTPSGEDVPDVADVQVQRWKTCSVIDRVVVQVVDEWGNPVDRLKEKLEVSLEVLGGTLQAEMSDKSSEGDAALRGTVKKESGERVWKKVKMRIKPGIEKVWSSLVAKCMTGQIEPATIELDCNPTNKVTKLEIEDSAYAPSAQPIRAGDRPKPLQVVVRTEDGQPYEGAAEAIKIKCCHQSNTEIDLYDMSSVQREANTNTFTFQPLESAVFDRGGQYTLMVWYQELRPALTETLMRCDQTLNAEKQAFIVRAGGAYNLRIKACEVSERATAAVTNGADPLMRQIAHRVNLALVDEFDNTVASRIQMKVGASIHLLKNTMQEKTKEVFCDLEFVFCNDVQRGQDIAKMRSRLQELEAEKNAALKEVDEKEKKVNKKAEACEKAQMALVQAKSRPELRGIPPALLDSRELLDKKIRELEQAMQERRQNRRPKVSSVIERLVELAKKTYGDHKVLGTVMDLCYVQDEDANRLISWKNQIDLKTILFKEGNDARDFTNHPQAQRIMGGQAQPRVLGLDMASRWPGRRDPGLNFLPHYRDDHAFLNNKMAINAIEFYDPANEHLRENLLWALVNSWVLMDTRTAAMDFMKECRSNRRTCPEMVARDDGQKIASNGVMGGNNGKAPQRLDYLENYFGSQDMSKNTELQVKRLKDVHKCQEDSHKTSQHYVHMKEAFEKAQQTAKRKAWDVTQEIEKQAQRFERATEDQDAARHQTPNAGFTPYSPGHGESKCPPVLADTDATIGMDTPIRFAMLDKDGTATFTDLALAENSGQDEEPYVLRFQVYDEKNVPIFRRREGEFAELYTRDDYFRSACERASRNPAPAEVTPVQAPPARTPNRAPSGGLAPSQTPRQPPSAAAQASQRRTPSRR